MHVYKVHHVRSPDTKGHRKKDEQSDLLTSVGNNQGVVQSVSHWHPKLQINDSLSRHVLNFESLDVPTIDRYTHPHVQNIDTRGYKLIYVYVHAYEVYI